MEGKSRKRELAGAKKREIFAQCSVVILQLGNGHQSLYISRRCPLPTGVRTDVFISALVSPAFLLQFFVDSMHPSMTKDVVIFGPLAPEGPFQGANDHKQVEEDAKADAPRY
uniref:Uncharacterized protein n=1 Tax=Panagrellus redivivus TaxID=6233 RepID=A0A7E4WAC1_PANRE